MTKTTIRERAPVFDGVRLERARRANRCAAELLLTLGAAPHTKGFSLLQNGVMLLEEQPLSRRIGLVDTVYPLIGQAMQREGSTEHAMRDTIRLNRQWKTAPLYRELFSDERAPTNAEFLYALSAYLRRRRSEP